MPLSIATKGTNLRDSKLLDQTLTKVVVPRPEVTGWKTKQYLCLDAGYVGYPVSKIAQKHSYYARVTSRAEERMRTIQYHDPDSKPRRWVWNGSTPGPTDTGNFWSASKRLRPATRLSYNWLQP